MRARLHSPRYWHNTHTHPIIHNHPIVNHPATSHSVITEPIITTQSSSISTTNLPYPNIILVLFDPDTNHSGTSQQPSPHSIISQEQRYTREWIDGNRECSSDQHQPHVPLSLWKRVQSSHWTSILTQSQGNTMSLLLTYHSESSPHISSTLI